MMPLIAVAVYFVEFYLHYLVAMLASEPPQRAFRLTAVIYRRYKAYQRLRIESKQQAP